MYVEMEEDNLLHFYYMSIPPPPYDPTPNPGTMNIIIKARYFELDKHVYTLSPRIVEAYTLFYYYNMFTVWSFRS